MSDHSDTVWDEYQWERFLQQQEKRTEKYMELLEKYLDHPQRDEIIAREMNWSHLVEENQGHWEDEVDAMFEQEVARDEDEGGDDAYPFEKHPLYRMALDFSAELGQIFDGLDGAVVDHPAANALQTGATVTAAKLAAALSDGDEIEDLGMGIAYLKRALFAVSGALAAVAQLDGGRLLDEARVARIRGMLFSIRDGIVSKMGECRAEFRRRHGK
jgi:hypothetical protein